uniref:WXG100 family type VII secretion target n=1 Tax=Eubacterium cellulosolvens TaxID=29322 RepID=UPI00048717C1|nr:WXG100 family type VII secretion target [[Eubacterium] cellulosolvens]
MGEFSVSAGKVRSELNELAALNSRFRKQVEELKQTESSLNGMWEGASRTAFHNAFHADSLQMESFYGTVLTFVRTLDEIVNKYEAAERQNLDIATRRNY